MLVAGDVIQGYKILNEFTVAGGGRCQWAFASKDGKEYFIKQFLSPKRPIPGSPGSEKTKAKKRQQCKLFEAHQERIVETFKGVVKSGGNIIAPERFFHEGSVYYKISEKVDASELSIKDIAKLPLEKRLRILKTITASLALIHRLGIVHGDLKPDNLLLKKINNFYSAKIIDMDDSYFTGESPLIAGEENIVGTINYYSPELGLFIKAISDGEEYADRRLETSSDIFALGVIFYEYLIGYHPPIKGKSNYTWQAVLNREEIDFSSLPTGYKDLVKSMLTKAPETRPTATQILEALKNISTEKEDGKEPKKNIPQYTGKLLVKEKQKKKSSNNTLFNFKTKK